MDKHDHGALVLWAADCAEHVLQRFEEERPEDPRPRRAIEAGRAWAHGEMKLTEARAAAFAAHAAAREADRAEAKLPPVPRDTPPQRPTSPPMPLTLRVTPSRQPPTLQTRRPPLPQNVTGSASAFQSTFGR